MADDTKKTFTLAELAEFAAEAGPVMKDVPGEDDEDHHNDKPKAGADKTPAGAIVGAMGRTGSKRP